MHLLNLKKFNLFFLLYLFLVNPLFSQENLSLELDMGNIIMMGDITEKTGRGTRFNFGIAPAFTYEFNNKFAAHARLMMGQANGADEAIYFETGMFEPSLTASYNILSLFPNKFHNHRLRFHAGIGWLYFNTTIYKIPGGPTFGGRVPNDDGYNSHTAVGMLGLNYRYPLTQHLGLNIGYLQRYNVDNGWVDGSNVDGDGDWYAMATLGLTFSLGRDIKEDETIIKTKEIVKLEEANDSLKSEAIVTKDECDAETKTQALVIAQQRDSISVLKAQLDSATTAPAPLPANQKIVASEDYSKTPMYHVVIGSFRSAKNARDFMNSHQITQPNIKIVYYKEQKLYRVIYGSFEHINAAKKALVKAKNISSDAWIVRF